MTLNSAIRTCDYRKVKEILTENPNLINESITYYGDSPLLLAVKVNNSTIAQYLLDIGADPYYKNFNGYNAFNVYNENFEFIKKYLKKYDIKNYMDNNQNIILNTSFLIAVLRNSIEVMEDILNLKADINTIITKEFIEKYGLLEYKEIIGGTALHLAAVKGWANITKVLLEQDIDINILSDDKSTAYNLAIKYNKSNTTRYIEDHIKKQNKQKLENIYNNIINNKEDIFELASEVDNIYFEKSSDRLAISEENNEKIIELIDLILNRKQNDKN